MTVYTYQTTEVNNDTLIKKTDQTYSNLFINTINMYYLYLCLCTSAKCMSVELKQFEKVYLFIWSHDFQFSMSLSLSPNSFYRQATECTEGGGLTREHCTIYRWNKKLYQEKWSFFFSSTCHISSFSGALNQNANTTTCQRTVTFYLEVKWYHF